MGKKGRSHKADCYNVVNWARRQFAEYKLPSVSLKGGQAHLQFKGWVLILLDDGTWFIKDTSGG